MRNDVELGNPFLIVAQQELRLRFADKGILQKNLLTT